MKAKILTALVGVFPAYLSLYSSCLGETIGWFMATSVVGIILMFCSRAEKPYRYESDYEDKLEKYKRVVSIARDLWIYHLSSFAIAIFIKSL